jgi:hypothetical protein
MDLQPFVDNLQRQLAATADAGGDEARLLAEHLIAPLDTASRLTLLDVLTEAAEEITCELAPGSVEVRLRGRDVAFVVTSPTAGSAGVDQDYGEYALSSAGEAEGEMSRINVRMPDHVKARIESAAARDGLSVNAWLVRAAAAALDRTGPSSRPEGRAPQGAHRFTGWAR